MESEALGKAVRGTVDNDKEDRFSVSALATIPIMQVGAAGRQVHDKPNLGAAGSL
jgi:hypothetical protein